jgi:hypothetical protein
MRLIGFCHGVMYRSMDQYSKENIDLFKDCGCNAIEIHCHSVDEIKKLDILPPLIESFDYRSVHLPCVLKYKNDETTNNVLEKIENFYNKINASLAIVHPDLVEDWNVFNKYTSVNWAIENMDDLKASYKNVQDLKDFFNEHNDWNFVLDVEHCYANDKTMKLAEDLITELRDKIKEIHLSGHETMHNPLHRTKQIEIIEYCKNLNVPIIIESTFEQSDNAKDVANEFNYILKNLK